MALRSLNSIAPERRKNKVAQKKSGFACGTANNAVNDENLDLHLLGSNRVLPVQPCAQKNPVPSINPVAAPAMVSSACVNKQKHQLASPPPVLAVEDAVSEIEYILSENLPDLDDVHGCLSTLFERLDSKDWVKVSEAINNLRQLAIFHESLILPSLGKGIGLLIKAMKNPRSALCKTAIMACTDLFRIYQDRMLTNLDPLLLQLLLKASQDKRFVCEEAEKALEVMTSSLSPAPLMIQMQPYVTHKNPRVRAKATACLCRCVLKLGTEGIRDFGFRSLLQTASSQLNDQLPEARESARKIVAEVYSAYPHINLKREENSRGHLEGAALQQEDAAKEHGEAEDWLEFCNSQLPPHVAQWIVRLTSVM